MNNSVVALKIIKNKKRFHKQALVEVKLLDHLKRADPNDIKHIVRIYDHFLFRNHLCITFEMMSINLYELLSMNGYRGMKIELVKKIAL